MPAKAKLTPEEREFLKTYRELVKKTAKHLAAYGLSALRSGSFTMGEARGPYHLPKNVLTAACLDMADEWGPPDRSHHCRADKRMIRNIRIITPRPVA